MIVVVWTVAASLGALLSAWAIRDSWLDLQALGEAENGRRVLARGWVRRELVRFGIQAVWALIGVVAWTVGPATASPTALLLVGTNVALAVNTVLDVRERYVLRRIVGP